MPKLWCVNVIGPDTVIPQPSRTVARERAKRWQDEWEQVRASLGLKPSTLKFAPKVTFKVVEWPWSAREHAAGLAKHGGEPEDFA